MPFKNQTVSTKSSTTISQSSTNSGQSSSQKPEPTRTGQTIETTSSDKTSSLPTCQSGFCLNGGSCFYSLDYGFGCKCLNGYSGYNCNQKLSGSNDTGLIVGILIPGLIIALLLGFVVYRYQKINNFKDIFK